MAFQAKNKSAKIFTPEFFPCVNRHTLLAFQPLINIGNDSGIRAAHQIDKTDEPPFAFEIEKGSGMQLIYQSLSLRCSAISIIVLAFIPYSLFIQIARLPD